MNDPWKESQGFQENFRVCPSPEDFQENMTIRSQDE